ncbi:MAG: hypothetical protein ABI345_00505 [Jatrophihabitans sp.]
MWRRLAAALTVLVLLAGCSFGDDAPRKFPARPNAGLASLLENPPQYTQPGVSSWAKDYTPSIAQFVDFFYAVDARKEITASLDKQGLRNVAHMLWITDDNIQNDIVLLEFGNSDGASARRSFVESVNSTNDGLTSYSIVGPGAPVVYLQNHKDTQGYLSAKAYATVNNYVVEMFVASRRVIPPRLIQLWLSGQVAKLG